MKRPDMKLMEKIGRNPYLKYNISSSNQVSIIDEAPFNSRGFFLIKLLHSFLNLLKIVAIMNI